jgi:hypothetical protein
MTDTRPPITEKTTLKLSIGVWAAVICSIAGWVGAFSVGQYRLGQHEGRIEALELQMKADGKLITAIDERTKNMQHQLDNIERKLEGRK